MINTFSNYLETNFSGFEEEGSLNLLQARDFFVSSLDEIEGCHTRARLARMKLLAIPLSVVMSDLDGTVKSVSDFFENTSKPVLAEVKLEGLDFKDKIPTVIDFEKKINDLSSLLQLEKFGSQQHTSIK